MFRGRTPVATFIDRGKLMKLDAQAVGKALRGYLTHEVEHFIEGAGSGISARTPTRKRGRS